MKITTKNTQIETVKKYEDQHKAYLAIAEFIESENQIFTLSGYAGTGKTFLTAIVAQQLVENNWRVVLTAPTNKAVKQLKVFSQSISSKIDTMTLAKLLGVKPVIKKLPDGTEYEDFEPEFGEECKIAGFDVIVVDEASMVSSNYFELLIGELEKASQDIFEERQKKIIFVGDPAQLPPVGERCAIAFSSSQAQAELKNIIRYDGAIIQLATHVRSSQSPNLLQFVDQNQVYSLEYKKWISSIVAAFRCRDAETNSDFCRVLSWTNKSVNHLNQTIRECVHGKSVAEYLKGERVIANKTCLQENNILLNNSEEAEILQIEWQTTQLNHPICGKVLDFRFFWLTCLTDDGRKVKLRPLFEQDKPAYREFLNAYVKSLKAGTGTTWKEFWKLNKAFHDLSYCYALTVHKSQGSTYNNVFVDLPDIIRNRKLEEQNKLLYVAVTRAKDRVLLLI